MIEILILIVGMLVLFGILVTLDIRLQEEQDLLQAKMFANDILIAENESKILELENKIFTLINIKEKV
jgi:hypothetical protein